MNQTKDARINDQINAKQVRLINEEGINVGVVNTVDAMRQAEVAALDLVEISPDSAPPVCKIMDYGKYRYELQKKAREAHKKQKVIEIKEVKFRPVTDKHDVEIKLNHATKFLADGNKVKFTLTFKGREMDHQEIGRELMQRIKANFVETAKIEQEPRSEGKNIIMIIGPK